MGRLTHTVSGSIATVRSPAVAPIESLKVYFSPIQEGTGDPSPSNIRPITGWTGVTGYKSGKNLFDISKFEGKTGITVNGNTMTGTAVAFREAYNVSNNILYPLYIPAGSKVSIQFTSYCDGANTSGAGFSINLYYSADSDDSIRAFYTNNSEITPTYHSGTITLTKDVVGLAFVYYNNALANTWTVSNIQIEIGPSATEYEPYKSYETIPVTFPAGGKNLIDFTVNQDTRGVTVSKENGKVVLNGTATGGDAYCITFIPMHLEPGTYTASSSGFTTGVEFVLTKNGLWFRNATAGTTFTLTEASTISGYVRVMNGNSVDATVSFMLEIGSTASPFEPYTDTAYGGYVDLATGDIVAEYGSYILTGSDSDGFVYRDTVTHGNNVHYQFGTKIFDRIAEYTSSTKTYCNIATATVMQSGWALDLMFYAGTPQYQVNFFVKDSVCEPTAESFNAWLSEHNVHFVYKLATPKLIATLTPQELATFKGYSNFWSNAGDVDVTYQVVESSEMTKERQKIFAGNAATIHTASGSVANFEMEPGLNRNLKSCKVGFLPVQEGSGDPFPPINQNGSIVGINNLHNESELSSFKIHFSPIQSGSGDPSPTNICPITGWTGVTGYKGGKNLLNAISSNIVPFNDSNFSNYTLNDGNIIMTNATLMGFKVKCKPSTKYTYSLSSSIDLFIEIGSFTEEPTIFSNNSTFIVNATSSKSVTFTTRSDTEWIVCIIYAPSNLIDTSATASNFQLEVGSVATAYEAYSAPTSYPVSWESQGTVYGGYVDLVSGDVYKTHENVDLGTLNYVYDSTAEQFVCYSGITFGNRDSFVCSNYKTQSVVTYWTEMVDKTISGHSTDHSVFRIKDTDYTDATAFKTAMDGVKLAYELITPVKVGTISPTNVPLTNGAVHSFWSNADAVTVETVGNVRPIKGWGKINAYSSDENLASNISNWSNMQNDNGCWKNTNVDTKQYFHCVVQLFNNSTYLKTVSEKAIKTIGANSIEFSIDVDNCTRIVLKHSGSARDLSLSISSNSIFSQGNYTIGFNVVSINSNVIGGLKISDIIMCPTSNYNICSITFPIQGKNLCPPLIKGKGVHANAGTEISANNIAVSDYIPVNFANNQNYYLSGLLYSYQSFVAAYNINKQYLGRCGGAQRSNLSITDSIFTVSTTQETGDIAFLRVEQYNITNMADINDAKIQLEVGSSATSYEPYDNSIFGGYVDLVSGKVYKTFINVDLSSCYWSYEGANTEYGYQEFLTTDLISTIIIPDNGSEDLNHLCSMYKFMPRNYQYGNRTIDSVAETVGGQIRIYSKGADTYASANAFREAMYGVKLCYELSTPQLVTTLTPTQIQALKGTNNILSDANGIIEVKYWSH